MVTSLAIFNLFFAMGVPNFHMIETDLRPYFDEFMNETLKICKLEQLNIGNRFIIGFDKTLSKDAVGECYPWTQATVIKIDEEYWNVISDNERRSLVIHELSHCVLLQDHVEDTNHYMYPYSHPVKKEDLINQLQEIARSKCESK